MKPFRLFICSLLIASAFSTPLDDYVNKPDQHYTWSVKDYTLPGSSFHKNLTGYVIDMTSQKWLDESYVNRPVWRHALVVIIPEEVEITDTAFMYVGGGGNDHFPKDWSDKELMLTASTASAARMIGAMIFQIPN